MRLFSVGKLVGDICPECVLAGPAGAAAKVRALAAGRRGDAGAESTEEDRTSWERRMEKRAQSLEGTASFSLAARQAAVRETRERR